MPTTTLRRKFAAAPAHLIPGDLSTLQSELAAAHAELGAAKRAELEINDRQLTYQAERDDREFLGEEARAGRTPKSATPNADKLGQSRIQAAQRVARAEAAWESVQREIDRYFLDQGQEVVDHTSAQLENARQDYADAMAALEAARRAYYEAEGVHRWATDGHEGTTSYVTYNPPRIEEYPLAAIRQEVEGVRRHRGSLPGFTPASSGWLG